MPALAPLVPQEPHDLDRAPTDQTATGAGAARGCPDESLERPDRTRLVPTVHARPTLAFQRRLIAGLVG